MELGRERLSNFFKDFKKFWDDLKVNVDENKLVKWHIHFQKFSKWKLRRKKQLYNDDTRMKNWQVLERDFYRIDLGRGLPIMIMYVLIRI